MPCKIKNFYLYVLYGEHIIKNFLGSDILKYENLYPKCIKKAVRYIKQDASKDQLIDIKKVIDNAIRIRSKTTN
ncbi:hypothetical protein M3610_07345 [Neobacillus sp. MER 74]|uniref:hypothetical protein n=1 Tax=Neobacillus sp. MER 74 TaxID=2939566 RepID=UPI00203DEB75|nr:hypothetical protein [Neobacillus sp. MER 74]MCM3115101.1 hypothetical protein [Neobacillus sp. MER 74]